MSRVPAPALLLGYLGLSPFVYGALLVLLAPGALPTFGVVAASPEGGALVLERFGAVILGFMGGCLWGFASARPAGPSLALLAASIIPAFLAFAAIRESPRLSCLGLAFGFVVLQVIDLGFSRAGVVPPYWIALRLPLTLAVVACLLIGASFG